MKPTEEMMREAAKQFKQRFVALAIEAGVDRTVATIATDLAWTITKDLEENVQRRIATVDPRTAALVMSTVSAMLNTVQDSLDATVEHAAIISSGGSPEVIAMVAQSRALREGMGGAGLDSMMSGAPDLVEQAVIAAGFPYDRERHAIIIHGSMREDSGDCQCESCEWAREMATTPGITAVPLPVSMGAYTAYVMDKELAAMLMRDREGDAGVTLQ